MQKFLSKIIPAFIFLCVIAASLVLAIIGFIIFGYILIFAIIFGAVIYIYLWLKYKITGKKSPYMSFQEAMRNAKKQAKQRARATHKKRTDYSKPDDPSKETIDQDDIDDKK